MRLHIELTAQQADELLEQALDGVSDSVRATVLKSDTLRRGLIRDAINRLIVTSMVYA